MVVTMVAQDNEGQGPRTKMEIVRMRKARRRRQMVHEDGRSNVCVFATMIRAMGGV
jgi:hypothetical protein